MTAEDRRRFKEVGGYRQFEKNSRPVTPFVAAESMTGEQVRAAFAIMFGIEKAVELDNAPGSLSLYSGIADWYSSKTWRTALHPDAPTVGEIALAVHAFAHVGAIIRGDRERFTDKDRAAGPALPGTFGDRTNKGE